MLCSWRWYCSCVAMQFWFEREYIPICTSRAPSLSPSFLLPLPYRSYHHLRLFPFFSSLLSLSIPFSFALVSSFDLPRPRTFSISKLGFSGSYLSFPCSAPRFANPSQIYTPSPSLFTYLLPHVLEARRYLLLLPCEFSLSPFSSAN